MAKTSIIHREKNRKFDVRVRQRCRICGRPRGYMRRFDMCRICFREAALQGRSARRSEVELVAVTASSRVSRAVFIRM